MPTDDSSVGTNSHDRPEDPSGPSWSPNRSTAVLSVYLAHLVVPLFLAIDLTFAWRNGYFEFDSRRSAAVVITISVVWLVAGLGAILLTRDRDRFLQTISRPLLTIYAIYLSLFVAELLARVFIPAPASPALWPPGSKWVIKIDPAAYAGVSGIKKFTVNEVGLRGPSLPQQNGVYKYKIVAVGGSTTVCAKLDDSEEWPHLLMQALNRQQNHPPVWVANAGVSGHTTVHHLMLLKTLPILAKVDMLILLIGLNDLSVTLAYEGAPTQADLEAEAERFRELVVRGGEAYTFPLCRRLRLVQLKRSALASIRLMFKPLSWQREKVEDFRKLRASSPVVPLPDLRIGLREYRGRVLALAEQCRVLAVRCLFLTQPSIWRRDLSSQEQALVWGGPVGRWGNHKGYASIEDLASALSTYNRTLLDVCHENRLECYDLASVIPQDVSAFYDDSHYNENGARIVAKHLADYFLARESSNDDPVSGDRSLRDIPVVRRHR